MIGIPMRIDRDGDEVSMVLSKQDMIDLKAMFDSHLLIPKYSGIVLEPKDTHEILGKLIRAFDLILENKNTGGKEIE